jgi:hypothetical protein
MKEWTKEQKLKVELDFLIKSKDLLKEHFNDNVKKEGINYDAFTIQKLNKLVDRMIDNEIDFLHDETDEYIDLYCTDHTNN